MARSSINTGSGAFVAVLAKRGKVFEAESAFGEEEKVFVGRNSLGGARSGDLVVLRSAGRGRGEVIKRLGKANSLAAIMEAILAHYRIPRGFSQPALEEATRSASLAQRKDRGRHDLTGMLSFTIDPDEARDYDDAISLLDGPGEDEITLYVHIADVSYFVAPGSRLDREAAGKACSVYLPVAVEPMLPAVLSSDICSLRPGVDRKCLTVEMVFHWRDEPGEPAAALEDLEDRDVAGRNVSFARAEKSQGERSRKKRKKSTGQQGGGEPRESRETSEFALQKPAGELAPVKVRFYRSTIRSRHRLTYNQVDDLFEGKTTPGGSDRGSALDYAGPSDYGPGSAGLESLLQKCRRFSNDLRTARHARGALAIHTYEPEFRLSEDGEIIGVRPRPESESHALIEEFMIAANEAVARFLKRRKSNCIYRVHEEPDAQAVDNLFDLLEDLGIPTPPFSMSSGSPQAAGEAIRELLKRLPKVLSETQREKSVFGEIVLRSLKQAIYLEENLGHFGLASEAYLHFTSPIRRYPDLVVHRGLLTELGIEQFPCDRLQLAETARVSSENERRAALVERTGDDAALAFLLDKMLFKEGWDMVFEGEIVSVIPSGLFVRFDRSFEGYIPARKLWGDYFAISEKGGSLVGRRSGRPYRLGDPMNVRVVNIDKLRGKVELEPAR